MSTVFTFNDPTSAEQVAGRESMIADFTKRLSEGCNMALIGMPRVGKTWIGCAVLERLRGAESGGKRILAVQEKLGAAAAFESFWIKVVMKLHDLAEEAGIKHRVLDRERNALEGALAGAPEYTFVSSHTELFFGRLRALGVRSVVFIDGFDASIRMSGGKRHYYEFIRNLASSADFDVSILLSLRQHVQRTETSAAGQSTLFGIFSERAVKVFEPDEAAELLSRLPRQLTDAERAAVSYAAGTHPGLLAMICARLDDEWSARGDFDAVEMLKDPDLTDAIRVRYDDIYKNIENDASVVGGQTIQEMVVEAVIGPIYELRPSDADMLINTGYIARDGNGYITISRGFVAHMRANGLSGRVWPDLINVQQAMQRMIKDVMPGVYGCEQWELEGRLRDDTSGGGPLVPNADVYAEQAAEDRGYPNGADCTIVDVLPFYAIKRVMERYWKEFAPRLGGELAGDAGRWGAAIDALNKVRNPLAHALDNILGKEQLDDARRACEKFKGALGLSSAHKRRGADD